MDIETVEQKIERYVDDAIALEAAVYEALCVAAESNHDHETAQLARQIQQEKSAMARSVFTRISGSSLLAVGAA